MTESDGDHMTDKKVDIIQANVEQYYRMAMDHYTKAGTTSQILLSIISAILILIGHDTNIAGVVDVIGAFMIIILGIFGVVWVGRQMERYSYWEHIALGYQKELSQIIDGLKGREKYEPNRKTNEHIAKDKPKWLWQKFSTVKDRNLWIRLHLFVAFMGLMLVLRASYCTYCPQAQCEPKSSKESSQVEALPNPGNKN